MAADYTPSGTVVALTDGSAYDAFPGGVQVGSTSLALWRTGPQHLQTPGEDAFVMRRSDDGGVTWSPPWTIAQVTTGGGITVLGDGTLFLIAAGQVMTSADLGLTWTAGATVDYGGVSPFPTDCLWVNDGSANGLVLAVAYDVGVSPVKTLITASADRGVTWTPYGTLWQLDGLSEVTLTLASDGRLLTFSRVDPPGVGGIYRAVSSDFGRTWTTPTLVVPDGTGYPSALSYQGLMVLMYRVGEQWDYAWAVSDDDGATWTPRGDFTGGGHRSLYGGFLPLPDGDLLAVYSHEFGPSDARVYVQRFDLELDAPSVAPYAPAASDTVTWYGCDLATGVVVAQLPDLVGQISQVLGQYTSANLTMPIPLGGYGSIPMELVEAATAEHRTMVVCVVNGVPIWAGIPLVREGGTGVDLQLGLVSVEGYLARRYVADHTWAQQDQSTVIAAGLLADAAAEGIGLLVDAVPSGTLRDRTYADQDDATVYDRLGELMAVQGGPEWTIEPAWTDGTRTRIALVVRVADRIGVASATPNAVFTSTGAANATYTLTEDYSDGRGANHIVATSSGEGTARPQSAPARDEAALASGVPRWEYRYSPSSAIADTAVLDAHAAAQLARMRAGAKVWRLTAKWNADPRLGLHWRLGDDIAWKVQGHRHPDGASGMGRCIGWVLDSAAGEISVILLDSAT